MPKKVYARDIAPRINLGLTKEAHESLDKIKAIYLKETGLSLSSSIIVEKAIASHLADVSHGNLRLTE